MFEKIPGLTCIILKEILLPNGLHKAYAVYKCFAGQIVTNNILQMLQKDYWRSSVQIFLQYYAFPQSEQVCHF